MFNWKEVPAIPVLKIKKDSSSMLFDVFTLHFIHQIQPSAVKDYIINKSLILMHHRILHHSFHLFDNVVRLEWSFLLPFAYAHKLRNHPINKQSLFWEVHVVELLSDFLAFWAHLIDYILLELLLTSEVCFFGLETDGKLLFMTLKGIVVYILKVFFSQRHSLSRLYLQISWRFDDWFGLYLALQTDIWLFEDQLQLF